MTVNPDFSKDQTAPSGPFLCMALQCKLAHSGSSFSASSPEPALDVWSICPFRSLQVPSSIPVLVFCQSPSFPIPPCLSPLLSSSSPGPGLYTSRMGDWEEDHTYSSSFPLHCSEVTDCAPPFFLCHLLTLMIKMKGRFLEKAEVICREGPSIP